MRDLALDPATGDLAISGGRIRLTAPGAESVSQKLRVRLRLFKGEWHLDASVGVPYYTDVLGRHPLSAVEALLRRAIVTCPGVKALESFVLTLNADRSASLTFTVRAVGENDPVTIEDFRVGTPGGR